MRKGRKMKLWGDKVDDTQESREELIEGVRGKTINRLFQNKFQVNVFVANQPSRHVARLTVKSTCPSRICHPRCVLPGLAHPQRQY
jgi:hypothetical protein